MNLRPPPRVVDVSLLLAVVAAFATGLASLVSGTPDLWWVFALHGAVGLALVALLVWKLRRVASRLRPSRWTGKTIASALTLAAATGALVTGIAWSLGGNVDVLAWNLMNVHVLFGLLLVVPFLVHLRDRFRTPSRAEFSDRRTALQYALLLGGGLLAWRLQRALVSALEIAGDRRFTSSRERGERAGNTFPVTSWVADDPDPIDPEDWSLRIGGAVEREVSLEHGDLLETEDELRATLDCTSGWYTTQDWRGVRLARLLDAVEPRPEANWVSLQSVTGYRFSLPIGEARDALLATHVGEEPLSHGHGFPARLVAPGRRGFQWVKWVESIEVRRDPDYGQWVAIFTSGFTGGRRAPDDG
jgi:DMSO/TMAO reductase YedYZ molybdopterin-dependent catalytic subunit